MKCIIKLNIAHNIIAYCKQKIISELDFVERNTSLIFKIIHHII